MARDRTDPGHNNIVPRQGQPPPKETLLPIVGMQASPFPAPLWNLNAKAGDDVPQCGRQGQMHDACMVHYVDLIPGR